MATIYTVTGNVFALIGISPRFVQAFIRTNVESGGALIDHTTNKIYLGGSPVDVATDGTFSAGLPATNATDLNVLPNTLRYELVVNYADNQGRVWESGQFQLTADLNLGSSAANLDTPSVSPAWRSAFRAEMEAIAGLTGEDAAIANRVNTPGSLTDVALAAKYAKADGSTPAYVPRATLTLPNPCYIAHRFGAGMAPEETMEAGRASIAVGADGLEADCQPLGDGALALIHDTTVDRTTGGTGTVASFSTPAFLALNAAAKFPWNGKIVPPAMLDQALNEFGGNTVLMLEPKDGTNATQIMDRCDALHLKGSVVLATSSRTVLQAIKARGYAGYYYWGTTTAAPTLADIVADGADYLGIQGDASGATDAVITTVVATGVPVLPYTINRRRDKTRLLGLGVAGFLGDQPYYLRSTTASRTVDSWRQGVLGHGLNVTSASTPSVVSAELSVTGTGVQYAVLGEVCPLANAAGSYVIDIDLGFSTLPADTTRAAVFNFALPDDQNLSYSSAGTYGDGYAVWLRANGTLGLFKLTAGVGSTTLGTAVATAALTAGVLGHVRITVSPTQITVARTDSAGTVGPVSDATFRGGYVSVGKSSTDGTARFKTLVIT